jgi:hypothetical protein
VLHGLERPDRATELDPLLGVLGGHLEAAHGAAYLLGGERDRRAIEHPRELVPAGCGRDRARRRAAELQPCLLARLVHGHELCPLEARRVAVHGEQPDPLLAARHHQDQRRQMAVEHVHLVPVEADAGARLGCGQRDARLVPASAVLGQRERRDRLAGRDPRQ